MQTDSFVRDIELPEKYEKNLDVSKAPMSSVSIYNVNSLYKYFSGHIDSDINRSSQIKIIGKDIFSWNC